MLYISAEVDPQHDTQLGDTIIGDSVNIPTSKISESQRGKLSIHCIIQKNNNIIAGYSIPITLKDK